MDIYVGHKRYKLDYRTRLVASTILVLVMHVLLFWVLISANADVWNLDQTYDEPPPLIVELWRVPELTPEKIPEPVPVPDIVPREVPPQPQPPQPEKTQAETPQPSPNVAPVDKPDTQKTITLDIPRDKPLDVTSPKRLENAPNKPSVSMGVRKKIEEEIEARAKNNIKQASDLNLHEAQASDLPTLQRVEPSGLTAAPAAGGRMGAMQPLNLNGTGLKGGRGQASQALQNHDWCVDTQQKGKPLPDDCKMVGLSGQKAIGPELNADYEAAVAKKAFKARPENAEYWDRVNHVPGPGDKRDNAPKKGAYADPKAQRVLGQCELTDTCK